MSYVREYIKSVHDALLAPCQLTRDLQHIIRGAIHNLAIRHPQQLPRYQQMRDALQNIQDTNLLFHSIAMTPAPIGGAEGSTPLQANASAPSLSAENSLGSYDQLVPATSSDYSTASFQDFAEKYLAGVSNAAQLQEWQSVDAAAEVVQRLTPELKTALDKVEKLRKHHKSAKMEAAVAHHAALLQERDAALSTLYTALDTCFPHLYKKVLYEYIQLCLQLCKAISGSYSSSNGGNPDMPRDVSGEIGGLRDTDAAISVVPSLSVEALQMIPTRGCSDESKVTKTSSGGSKLLETSSFYTLASPSSPDLSAALPQPRHCDPVAQPSLHSFTDPPCLVSSLPPPPPPLQLSIIQTMPDTLVQNASLSLPAVETGAGAERDVSNDSGAALSQQVPPSTTEETAATSSLETATSSTAGALKPSLRSYELSFRYFDFDRLISSTGRLSIAYVLYVDYSQRLVRKTNYHCPLNVKGHMERVSRDFERSRFTRHHFELQRVLKGILNCRKDVELLAGHCRNLQEAEAKVKKYTTKKSKKAKLRQWTAVLEKEQEEINILQAKRLTESVTGLPFLYEELMRSIQATLTDLILTLGGTL